jgi:hypothetical protein
MKEYSFLDNLLLINGVEISNFDEGDDVIQLDRLNDSASHTISVDGVMTVSLSADRSGTIMFRLNQTSDSNKYLSGLVNAQENGAFVPIFAQFKNTRGGDLGSGTQGYIQKPAGMSRGKNANSQEWTIVVERLDLIHGG